MAQTKNKELTNTFTGFGIRHVQMVCMCFCIFTLYIARSCMSVAVLAMTDSRRRNDTNVVIYDWNKQTQSIILSSFFWGYTVMQLPGGMLARKFGGKPVLLAALIANGTLCLSLPTIAFMGGWKMVCATRVAMGLTQACLFPSTHTLLGRWLPLHERTAFTGVVYAGSQLGIIAALPISGLLADTAMGWKLIFYAIAGLLFATAIIWYLFAASYPGSHKLISEEERNYIEKGLYISSHQNSLRTPWKQMLKTKALWAVLVTQVSCGVSFVVFFIDLPTYLERGLGISLKNSAYLSTLPFVGMWLTNVVASLLSDWISSRGLLSVLSCRKLFNSIALSGTALSLIGLSFLGPERPSLAIAAVIAAMSMNGCSAAGYLVNLLDLTPNYGGVLLGMTNGASAVGAIITPLVSSFILRNDATDMGRWHILFLGFAALNVISNIIYLVFASSDRQEWDDPHFFDSVESKSEEMQELKPKQQRTKTKQSDSIGV